MPLYLESKYPKKQIELSGKNNDNWLFTMITKGTSENVKYFLILEKLWAV